jgi:hypothetical protein
MFKYNVNFWSRHSKTPRYSQGVGPVAAFFLKHEVWSMDRRVTIACDSAPGLYDMCLSILSVQGGGSVGLAKYFRAWLRWIESRRKGNGALNKY